MEAVNTSEILVNFYQITWHYNSEDSCLYSGTDWHCPRFTHLLTFCTHKITHGCLQLNYSPWQGIWLLPIGKIIYHHFVTVDHRNVIVHSFSYEIWPSLGSTTAIHNSSWWKPLAKAFSCHSAVVWDISVLNSPIQSSVVTFYHLANASFTWATLLGCEIYLATLLNSALHYMTQPELAEEQMDTVSANPTLPTPVI
jgi:hypothetical protein